MKPAEVTAVQDKDGMALLDLLGVGDGYRAGTLRCAVCGTPLREHCLGAASKRDDSYRFACERLDCLEEFHRA